MTYIQATQGGGGWPMSCFLTPTLEPFFGGTYFPPDDSQGRPGFKTVLRRLAEVWAAQREDIKAQSKSSMMQLAGVLASEVGGVLAGWLAGWVGGWCAVCRGEGRGARVVCMHSRAGCKLQGAGCRQTACSRAAAIAHCSSHLAAAALSKPLVTPPPPSLTLPAGLP